MSINHLIDIDTKPKYDIYVNGIEADSVLAINNMKAQGRMTADTFKLATTQEVAIAILDTDQYKFATNLTVPANPWYTISQITSCKMTRDKLHLHPDSDAFRKVFNFDINVILNVDYSLRGGDTSAAFNFICNGFFNFVPVTTSGARINKIVFNQGHFYTYNAVSPSGVFGQIRSFENNNIGIEGFDCALLPVSTLPTSGTESWYCQFRVSIMDSEILPAVVPPP
jgi:hypothetical protein